MSTTLVCGSALEISGCIPWGISAKFVPADRRGSPPQYLTGAGIGRPISGQVAFTMKSVLGGGRVVLARDVQGRARDVPRLLRRLGARWHGLPVLQLRHPVSDRWLAPLQGAGGNAADGHAARFRPRRLAFGANRRSDRLRAYAPD